MKSIDFLNPKATLQQCEMKTQLNLLKNEFIKLNSNLNLNSVFKTPNVKSYNLLKEDFHVIWSFGFFIISVLNSFVG